MPSKVTPLAELTIPTAGTAVQASATPTQAAAISFEADKDNTGYIYIGLSDVSSDKYIAALKRGEQLEFEASIISGNTENYILSDYYIDTETNGNTVHISYQHRR